MTHCTYCGWKGRGIDALVNHWKNCKKKAAWFAKYGKSKRAIEHEKRYRPK